MSFTRDTHNPTSVGTRDPRPYDPATEPLLDPQYDPGRESTTPQLGTDALRPDARVQTPTYGNAPPTPRAGEFANGSLPAWRDRLVLGTLQRLFRHRFLCLALVAAAGCSGGVATLFMRPFYIARASIFPPATDNPLGSFGLPSMIGMVGNFSLGDDGASLFPLYEKFLFSRTLIENLLQLRLDAAGFDGTLMDYLAIEEPNATIRSAIATSVVREGLSFEADKKTVVVTVGYQDADPKVAAAVVNEALELLDRFDVSTAARRASERRHFIEGRMNEASQGLMAAERSLEKFREENLRIGNAPELQMEQARLQREIEIQQQVYLTLRKEYELTRIEELRTVPVVNVLDRAMPPLVPSGPSLVRNAGLAGFLGAAFVVLLVALQALGLRRMVIQFVSPNAGR